MLTRRLFLKSLLGVSAGSAGFGGYALAEPFRLNVTRHRLTPTGWPSSLTLRLAVIADLHICEPWMSLDRVRQIVNRANALAPDAVLLLGDYVIGHGLGRFARPIAHHAWATELARLKAPLGVHAVLGNHDWWEDESLQVRRQGPTPAGRALEAVGIPVYENNAVRLEKNGRPFWLAGLGDQWAFWPKPENYAAFKRGGKVDYEGVHDLAGTLAAVMDDAPVVLMAHEPDIFPSVPARVSLTISGHTHGGQVRVLGFAPIVPSRFGRRYVYGHIVEDGRHLVVSGGLGCSGYPVRFGSPPEVVLVELG
ncbi:MAG: metallophosphoesterase [Hyphomicrobium sp.]|nr:metallophosphoesterase [Hyphomicrobium sp.]